MTRRAISARDLRLARAAAGHSQEACASELSRLGGGTITQPLLSAWESGKSATVPEDAAHAIESYINCELRLGIEPPTLDKDSMNSADPAEADFPSLVLSISGEPLLSPRQGALVDGLVFRLSHGPPMSVEDRLTALALAKILGLPPSG